MPRKDSYKPEEMTLLKEIFENNPKEYILSRFNRSWQSVRLNAKKLGLKRNPEIIKQEMIQGGKTAPEREDFWTAEEDNLLREIYQNNSKDFILSQFKNRTWKAIRERAIKLGLSRDKKQINKERVKHNKETIKTRYGVDYSTQLPSMQEKSRQTNLERRGVEYPSQSTGVRKKVKKTVQNRYGVDNVFQSEEIKSKIEQTNIEKYGVPHPNQNEEVREKTTQTNLKKYGVKNPFQMVNWVQQGMLEKYGEIIPLKISEFKKKAEETNIQRYGTKTPAQNTKIQEKIENTNKNRYGVKTPFQSGPVKQKIIQTNKQRYGIENPAQYGPFKDKAKKTCLINFGVEYSLQSEIVRKKGYETAKRNKSFSKSKGETIFLKYLKFFDSKIKTHVRHPILKHVIDYYMPQHNLWVQYDGIYWHGKIKRENNSRHTLKIKETVKRDQLQNEKIPNLIRFWSDETILAIKTGKIFILIEEKIKQKSTNPTCHQFKKKIEWYYEDFKILGLDPNHIRISDFLLSPEVISIETKKFIEKYEWLGTIGVIPKWCFTARYKGVLGGVVLINEPTAYSKILGENTHIYEALIQRGATASWTPKNLGSHLIMFACKWMVWNTDKRAFIAYGDPKANELGIIYQACNFEYLGNTFGNKYLLSHPMINQGKLFSSQILKRTSTFKKWCKENQITVQKTWINEKGFKDINNIPHNIKDEWKKWINNLILESKKTIIQKKYKYVLIRGKNKKEAKFLKSLKNYKTYSYPKFFIQEQSIS